MKPYSSLLTALALVALPAFGQVTVVPATPVTPGATVTVPVQVQPAVPVVVSPPPASSVVVERERAVNGVVVSRTVDSTVARQQLSIAPRVVVTTSEPAVVPQPSRTVTETTSTTVERDRRGRPHRVYNVDRNIVIVKEANQTRELPYVTVPVLFVQGTAELLDAQSAAALQQMAGVILEVASTNPNARFDIEGHTSTEGTDEMNLNLSVARAQRIYDELTQRYNVPPATLSAHGYGEAFPAFPNGTEDQLQRDRRVLVVRAQ
jgi:outer membrane protein OmpA-like peptidoglycan-associated protein